MRRLLLAACLLLLCAWTGKNYPPPTDVDALISQQAPTFDFDSSTAVVEVQPLYHYLLEDNAASTAVVDKSGTANGTASANTSTFCNTAAKVSKGCTFAVASSHSIDMGADTISTGADSVCAWVKPTTAALATDQDIADNGKFIFFVHTDAKLGFTSDGTTTVYSAGAMADATFAHVCITRTAAGVANFYINGAANGTADQASGTPAGGTGNTIIGNNGAGNRDLGAVLDDVRIYNRALTPAEVYGIYSGGGAGLGHQAQAANKNSHAIVTDAAGAVAAIQSKGIEFSQSIAADRPTLSTLNSRRVLVFDGTDDYLQSTTALSSVFGASAKTGIFVFQPVLTGVQQIIFEDLAEYFFFTMSASNGFFVANYDGTTDAATASPVEEGKPTLFTVRHDGSDLTIRRRGAAAVHKASGATTVLTNALLIGRRNSGGDLQYNGKLGRITLLNKVLPENIFLPIEQGLARRFGVSLASATAETSCDNYIKSLTPTLWLDASTVEEGPVVHYKMEDSAADKVITDSTGNFTGTAVNNTNSFCGGAAKISNGCDFNQGAVTTDAISMGNLGITTGNFSVCAWIYKHSTGGGTNGRIIDFNGSQCLFSSSGSGNKANFMGYATADNSWPLNTWVHTCAIRQSGASNGGAVYINGSVSYQSGTVNGNNCGGGTYLIGNTDSVTRGWDGLIDDVRIYDYALSAQQVANIYNAGTGHQYENTAGPSLTQAGSVTTDETGSTVYAWQSKFSATPVEFTQTTDANKPTWTGTGVDFDGTNDVMTSLSTLDTIFNNNAKTIIFVFDTDSVAEDRFLLSDSVPKFFLKTTNAPNITVSNDDGAADTRTATVAADTLYIAEAYHDTNLGLTLNGVATATTASGNTADVTGTLILGGDSASANPMNGKLREVIADDSVWTADQRARVSSCLGAKYGVTF